MCGKDHNEDPCTKVVVYYCGAQAASFKATHLTGPHQGKEEPRLFTIPQQTGRAENAA